MLLNDGNDGSWLLPELQLASDFSFFNSGDFTGVLCMEAGLGVLCIEGGFGGVGAGLCLRLQGYNPCVHEQVRPGALWMPEQAVQGSSWPHQPWPKAG